MDRVRFGRALGYGARHAAKALVQAADAATTPAAAAPLVAPRPVSTAPRPDSSGGRSGSARPQSAVKARAKHVAKQSFLHPLKRYSGTVMLQVVGTFFAVFALLMGQTAWKLRAGWGQRWNSIDAQHLWLAVGFFLLFSWFAVSSFLRASRLEKS